MLHANCPNPSLSFSNVGGNHVLKLAFSPVDKSKGEYIWANTTISADGVAVKNAAGEQQVSSLAGKPVSVSEYDLAFTFRGLLPAGAYKFTAPGNAIQIRYNRGHDASPMASGIEFDFVVA